jgi:hypothetical protein
MPDPPTTALVSARATVRDGENVTFYARTHQVEVGVPLSFDVKEPRLTAVEQFVAALSADVLGGFARLASRERLRVDEIEASVQAEIADPLAYLGVVGEPGHPRLARLSVRAFLGTSEPPERVQPVWEKALERAPLVNTVRPVVALDLQWQRAL